MKILKIIINILKARDISCLLVESITNLFQFFDTRFEIEAFTPSILSFG